MPRGLKAARRKIIENGIRRAITLVLALVALGAAAAAQSSELPDLKGRSIVAVTENAFAPLNFADPKTGKGIGWEYDAIDEIASRLDLKVTWKTSGWDSMIQSVHDGQYDVGMDGISITDDRKDQVDFSDPYLSAKLSMLVRADEKRFTDPTSFAADPGLLVGAQAGTTGFYWAAYRFLGGDEKSPRIKLYETISAPRPRLWPRGKWTWSSWTRSRAAPSSPPTPACTKRWVIPSETIPAALSSRRAPTS